MNLDEKYRAARHKVVDNGIPAFMKTIDGVPFDSFLYLVPLDKTMGRIGWSKTEVTFDFAKNAVHIKGFPDLKAEALLDIIDDNIEGVSEKEVRVELHSPEGRLSYDGKSLIEAGFIFKLRQFFKRIGV